MLLDAQDGVLFIVDIQARLAPAMPDPEATIARTAILLAAAERLDVPIVASEQYPQGLGHTDERLPLPRSARVFAKTSFSAMRDPAILAHLESLGRRQIVLCGIETHVCVNQSAHDLLKNGYAVHLLTDCVGSRFEHDKLAGLEKMRSSGVVFSSVEMALFELMRDAKHEKFKEVQALIK